MCKKAFKHIESNVILDSNVKIEREIKTTINQSIKKIFCLQKHREDWRERSKMSFFRKAQKDLEKEKVLEKEKESNASQDAESQSVTSNNKAEVICYIVISVLYL